jgi:hypothetical protein
MILGESAGYDGRIEDPFKIRKIRVIFTDFDGTCPVAGSRFIAPRHLQTTVGHMSHHMSTREVADMLRPAGRGFGFPINRDALIFFE